MGSRVKNGLLLDADEMAEEVKRENAKRAG
jgi:hypothetical protein